MVVAVLIMVVTDSFAQRSFFALTYSTSLPMGKTKDLIGQYSWRGFAMEGRGLITPNIALGGYAGWNVFYEKLSGSFTEGTVTFTGTQNRYINVFPIMFNGYYQIMNNRKVIPFFGTGVGLFRIERRLDFGIWTVSDRKWHLGFQPEAGVLLGTGNDASVLLSVKYNYALKTGETPAYSAINFNIGIAFHGN